MRKMQLCSLWVSVFAVKNPLPLCFEGAYVSHGKTLSWISNNTKKMKASVSPSLHPISSLPISSIASSTGGSKDSNNIDLLSLQHFPTVSSTSTVPTLPTPPPILPTPPVKFSYAAAMSKNINNANNTHDLKTNSNNSTTNSNNSNHSSGNKNSTTTSTGGESKVNGSKDQEGVECWTLTSTR